VVKVFAKHMKSRAPVPFGIGHGSSTSFRREAFRQIKGFDERLGGGAPLKSADDTEMFWRILKSGHSIVYEPAAVVRHKHGLDQVDVYKTRYGYSYGGAAFMWENRGDALMLFMFCGRLVQLTIKTTQYKLTGKSELFKSFNSDLRGFLDGWKTYRKLRSTTLSPAGKQPAIS
jgi:GT2 family glycosyltransferase